jgi:asparagine synthase (glutamine-hydrolysing)
MCGIAGVITSVPAPVEAAMLDRLSQSLARRGPDDTGFLTYDGRTACASRDPRPRDNATLAFVHRRLAILDLSPSGWQPMSTPDGRYHIVYNGEIYNYVELRKDLESAGATFHSTSDTEVLLALLARDGDAALGKLEGMFAFALLDTRDQRVLLARDPFGIKPLYFAQDATRFAFASDVHTLLAFPWVSRTANAERTYEYLRYGTTDHGVDTMLAGVSQVPAGHFSWVSLGGPWNGDAQPYWRAQHAGSFDGTFSQAAEALRVAFLDSVRVHLRSDVPLGSALSGGIDSSAIVMAVRHVAGSTADIHTFSYAAGEGAPNEERWVREVVASAHAEPHVVRLDASDLQRDFKALIEAQGFPFRSTSIYAQFRVFELAKRAGVKVMLDGQGADELLGGYRHSLAARLGSLLRQRKWRRALTFARASSALPGENAGMRSLAGAGRVLAGGGAYLLGARTQALARRAVGRSAAPEWLNVEWLSERGVVPRSMLFNAVGNDVLRWSLRDLVSHSSLPALLRFEDRNSMWWSIESRVPFLTTRLAELALSFPEEYLITNEAVTKAVFREAMRGIVPQSILDRKDKVGFATPEGRWMQALGPWIGEMLSPEALGAIPVLRSSEVRREWTRVRDAGASAGQLVWRWCNFVSWARAHDVRFD